jgi:RNA polymerase-binding transcription factor
MTTNGIVEKLTQDELQQFQSMLLERRRLLLSDFRALEEDEAQAGSADSVLSTHLADVGTDRASSDVNLECQSSTSSEIRDIDEALDRIRDGSYGQCEGCDRPIAKARLEAIPYARLCLPCKTEEES